jgi:hypothetical protein
MTTTSKFTSVKLATALVEEARQDGEAMQRSIAGQVEYWARLGQAVETMPSMTLERIRAAMKGLHPVEQLSVDERAIFDDMVSLERWRHSQDGNTELAKKFMAEAGHVGRDDAGNLVETVGDGMNVRIIKPAETA